MKLANQTLTCSIFQDLLEQETVKEYLNELRFRSEVLRKHSLHVGLLSIDIAIAKGIVSHNALRTVGLAGLFHEIGSLNLDFNLFNKEQFSPEEIKLIRECPRRGFMALQDLRMPMIARIVITHYEYFTLSRQPRYQQERRKRRRLDSNDRRKSRPQVKQYAKIVALANILEPNYHLQDNSLEPFIENNSHSSERVFL